jgi:serine/threonine-protein kinase RsbW
LRSWQAVAWQARRKLNLPLGVRVMNQVEQCTLQARMADLSPAVAFVEGFCAAHGIDPGDTLRLTLMVEELFTNTVEHGHGGDSEAPVRLTLRDDTHQLELFYEDRAPAFNPLDRVAEVAPQGPDQPDEPADFEALRPGGLGVVLVLRMAANARYAYEDGCNRLWLGLRRGT